MARSGTVRRTREPVAMAMEWELYQDAPASAAVNMARDEVCLERARRSGRACLRLYAWERLALSVGRAQRVDRELDPAACRAADVPLVRRITGGRAVLHGSDLTYALAAPRAHPGLGGGILPIYRSLSRVFVRFLAGLGLQPEVKAYSGRERAERVSAICFATPSAFELLVGGRKLVGSAQRLLPEAFLQHGSLPLAPQFELLARLFRGATADALRGQMTDLESLGVTARCALPELRERLARAFAEELGVTLRPAAWDAEAQARVEALLPHYAPLGDAAEPAPARPIAARG
jgi:lipoyl(octanoyl) transferase